VLNTTAYVSSDYSDRIRASAGVRSPIIISLGFKVAPLSRATTALARYWTFLVGAQLAYTGVVV
jgi:hypothetical protein